MLSKYEPWNPMRQLRDEVNQAFGHARGWTDDASSVLTSRWRPAVDIKEENEQFVISADVPGVDPAEIEVTMENGVLTIRGERQRPTEGEMRNAYEHVERLHGTFYRRFSLPDTADAEKITATGKNGVLEVVIPKKASIQPKRIKVAA